MAVDYDKRTDNSEYLQHETITEKGNASKTGDTYEQTADEKKNDLAPKEAVNVKNAYEDLSVGASKNGVLTISMGVNHKYNGNSVCADRKKLSGSRRRRVPLNTGELLTNTHDSKESAVGFRVDRRTPERRIIRQLREQTERMGQNTVKENLPFLALHEDKKRLNVLRSQDGRSKDEVEARAVLEHRIQKESYGFNRFLRQLKRAKQIAAVPDKPQEKMMNVLTQEVVSADDDGDESKKNTKKPDKKL